MSAPQIFVSYSHRDSRWKDRFARHLRVLERERAIDLWDDSRLAAGSNWLPEIEEAIENADAAILLVSADFLTSQFILAEELSRILRRNETTGLPIVPVLVEPCPWKQVAWLAELQLRPRGAHPLARMTRAEAESALAAIAQELVVLLARPAARAVRVDGRGLGPQQLTFEATPLVGRTHEIDALTTLLADGDARLVTLTGAGGTGKTRLALAAAEAMRDRFRDGTVVVSLGSLTNPDLIPSAIVHALGAAEEMRNETALAHLADALGSRRLLLVIDNFEHLMAGAALVPELLAVAPGLKILVTSREVLRVSGEREFPVSPLSVPPSGPVPDLEALGRVESVALFVERASAANPAFELTEGNADAIAEICARLDGLPLAIELAAARVKLLRPEAMLSRLERRLDLLTFGRRDLPERQRTLRDTINWSYELLAPDERRLFERLSVFAGGCTPAAATAICGADGTAESDVLDALTSLTDKSLLRHWDGAGGEPRFGMLETIREYARERLQLAAGHDDEVRRHAEYYAAFAESAAPNLTGASQVTWLERLDEEHDNLRAALAAGVERDDAKLGLRIVAALWRFWWSRGYVDEGLRWFEIVLRLDRGGQPALRARALSGAAALAFARGDHERAEAQLTEALLLARENDDGTGVARVLNALGVVSAGRTDYAAARRHFDDSLRLFRELGDLAGQAATLDNAGTLSLHEGDHGEALRRLEEALALSRELGNTVAIANVLDHMALVALESREPGRARALLEESLDMLEAVGDRESLAECIELVGLAGIEDEPLRAAQLIGAASGLRETIGVPLRAAEGSLYERHLDVARTRVGRDAIAAAQVAGRAMPLQTALREARELVRGP